MSMYLIWFGARFFMTRAGHVAHTRKKRSVKEFWWGNLKERDYLEYWGVEGGDIEYIIKEIVCEGVEWIDLAQDAEKWWPLLNTEMKF